MFTGFPPVGCNYVPTDLILPFIAAVIVFQHQLKLLEAQKRQQELILRRKTEEVSSSREKKHTVDAEILGICYGCRSACGAA